MSITENFQNANAGGSVPAIHLVPFHGDTLATLDCDGTHYVAMRRIVENMGIDWASQSVKLNAQRDKFNCCDIPTVGADGKQRDMLCMQVEKLALWLACLNANKVRPDLKPKVERYQEESAIALHDYWTRSKAPAESSMMAALEARLERIEAIATELAIVSDPRRAALEFTSVRELLDDAGALSKGRNSLNRRVGRDLRGRAFFALVHGGASPVRQCPHTDVWLFRRTFAESYMVDRGFELVREHNDKVSGQSVLLFPDRRASNANRPSPA